MNRAPGEAWTPEALLREHAAARGGAPAILDGGAVTTWTGLDARVDAVADLVRRAGIGPGGLVAIEPGPAAATIALILGVLRAGAVASPLPAGQTHAERGAATSLLRPALVVGPASAPTVSASPADQPPRPAPDVSDDPEAPAVAVLTSGTTGRPKAVVLSRRALAASADAWRAALPPVSGWVLALGLAHVAGLGVVWRAIADGAPIRVVPAHDVAALLEALGDPATSHVSLVPTQLARLLDLAGGRRPPPGLRAVLLGGGVIAESLVRRAVAAGWPVMPTYGLSEMGSGVTALSPEEAEVAPGTVGRPLPGVSVEIAGADRHGVGEIVVGGPAAFLGHLGEATRVPGEPFRTGDLGRLDAAGRLVIVDRRTDRIVRGGENVAPAEVEAVLLTHPAIADAGVVARHDEALGQVPAAAVVLRADAVDPGDAELVAHARGTLAGFKVPVSFTRLDVLPRTPSGKLRRGDLRALLDGAPEGQLERPGGDRLGWRLTGDGPRPLVLLHGTLSTARQLDRLAVLLASGAGATVHALDRRGSGTGRLEEPRPLDVAVHVADLLAYLDARGIGRVDLVGVSFGGVLALEAAARHPDRVASVAAYEPPYGALEEVAGASGFPEAGGSLAAAYARGGAPGVAETFVRAVAGDAAWDRLSARGRAFLEAEGVGALADGMLLGLRPDGLPRIAARVLLLTGGASEPFYAPLADDLARRIPGARRDTLDGLDHPAPITRPGPVADAVRAFLEIAAA